MEVKTAEIIMLSKGHHPYGRNLSQIERLRIYLAHWADVDIQYVTDTVMADAVYAAFTDYLTSCESIRLTMTVLKDVYRSMGIERDLGYKPDTSHDLTLVEALMRTFVVLQVRRGEKYVNGFTEANTQPIKEGKS